MISAESSIIATAKFDIQRFLRSQSISYVELPTEINFSCPFCSDTRSRFYINKRTKANLCHNCGFKGSLTRFVRDVLGVSWEEAEDVIAANKGRRIAAEETTSLDPVVIDWPVFCEKLRLPADKSSERYWTYLMSKRHLSPEVILKYDLRYCYGGVYSRRVIVPVYWFDSLVSWVGRSILRNVAKSKITPPGNRQSDYLYNLDRLWGSETIVLCEGVFDALRIPEQAVCSFGKTLSAQQLALLRQSGAKHIIVTYDSDAKDENYKTASRLATLFKVSVADLPAGEDPGSLPEAQLRDCIRAAIPYSAADYLKWRMEH